MKQLTRLCEGLLDALDQFDSDILPLGLYSGDDLVEHNPRYSTYQEWERAIVPYFTTVAGCECENLYPISRNVTSCDVLIPEFGQANLILVRASHIKVRKYGSGYQVDKRDDRSYRWKELDFGTFLYNLPHRKPLFEAAWRAKLLLFMGFDNSPTPFRRELEELCLKPGWPSENVNHYTRTWKDKAKRGFSIHLSLWSHTMPLD
jgi:hypothetical protein